MNKIKSVSFYVARILDILVIALPVFIILEWIFIDLAFIANQTLFSHSSSTVTIRNELIHLNQVAWVPLTQFIGCIAQIIEFGPFLGILYFLSKIFHRYKVGQIFTLANAQCYYQIGKLLFFDALLAQPISGCLWVLAVTLSHAPGKRYMSFTIGTPNIMAILMGLLVVFISWVMIEGSTIQDEQQLII